MSVEARDFERAFVLIFGRRPAPADRDPARWAGDLRRAFRARALEAHPDRALVLGRPEQALAEAFHQARWAHELLRAVADGTPVAVRPSGPPIERPRPPSRRVRLAEYLYASGRISWECLLEALVWQQRQRPRPRIGEFFVRRGLATAAEIATIAARLQ